MSFLLLNISRNLMNIMPAFNRIFINFLNLSSFARDSLSIKICINIYLKLRGVCGVISEMEASMRACGDVEDFNDSFLRIC